MTILMMMMSLLLMMRRKRRRRGRMGIYMGLAPDGEFVSIPKRVTHASLMDILRVGPSWLVADYKLHWDLAFNPVAWLFGMLGCDSQQKKPIISLDSNVKQLDSYVKRVVYERKEKKTT